MATPSSSKSPAETPPKDSQPKVSFKRATSDSHVSKDLDDNADEQSPLLPPTRLSREEDDSTAKISLLSDEDPMWPGEEHLSRSSWYMFLLTLGGFGLQMGWSVEMSNGSPYLLSLGLNKSVLALVWIAGPLAGVLVQPYVGIKSDRCRSRFGKRRPFIVGGALATIVSIMVLAWAREIVGGTLGIFGASPESKGVRISIQIFAVIFVYVLDFAINVLQAGLRAYAVDNAPTHQQESANAWISRMSGVGNIFGMFCGGVNLPKYLPFLGNSQFKVLCSIAAISMAVTIGISVVTVPERDPRQDVDEADYEETLRALAKSLWGSVFRLPEQIAKVCRVQILAWIGWFPFLFYTTTYIGEIYVEPFFEENPNMSQSEVDALWERGTRRGTVAMLGFAIVTFVGSIILPFIVAPTYQPPKPMAAPGTPLTPTVSNHMSGSDYFKKPTSPSKTWRSRMHQHASTALTKVQIKSLTLRRMWLLSHLLFAGCMWSTFIVRSVPLATVLVSLVGIPWAVTMWAPFALISSEISKRDAIRRGLIRPPPTRDGQLLAANEDDAADQAGVVLGIHNVAISAPQVLATVVGSLIFKALQKPRGTPGDESVAWFFRLGGLCALAAAWLTTKVGEDSAELFEVLGG